MIVEDFAVYFVVFPDRAALCLLVVVMGVEGDSDAVKEHYGG